MRELRDSDVGEYRYRRFVERTPPLCIFTRDIKYEFCNTKESTIMSEVTISNAQSFMSNGGGGVSGLLLNNGFDVRCLRPFLENGVAKVTKVVGKDNNDKPVCQNVPIQNVATLRRDDWIQIDEAVVRAARPRLRFFNDLRAQGLNVNLPNALGKTVWQYERQSSISGATVSMDGLRKGDSDRPVYDMDQMPLPIIHKDFSFSARQIAVSRNSNMPIDVTTAAMASQMVAEKVEKLSLGVDPEFQFGGGNVYGVCNYPQRLTTLFTNPWLSNGARDTSWTPGILQREILKARRDLADRFHYGPFAIYHSPDFDEILDDDYNITTSGISTALTLRERLLKIDSIQSIKTSEFLPYGTFIMLEMNPNTIQAVTGMDVTTVQWQTEGGFEIHFKVICILLPRMKSDFYGNCGIVHARLKAANDPA